MLFQTAEKFLSPPRLAPYKAAAGGDEQAALRLYFENLRIGQGYHVLLALLEVSFRNALHTAVAREFRSDNWLLEQQTGFMRHPSLIPAGVAKSALLRMIHEAIKEYQKHRGHLPTHGQAIIANLSFGFWTTLFTKKPFFLLNRAPLRAFRYRPHGLDWTVISDRLTEVRLFRNRVYHHEPLCLDKRAGTGLCVPELEQKHTTIIELLSWLDPALPIWAKELDTLPDILRQLRATSSSAS